MKKITALFAFFLAGFAAVATTPATDFDVNAATFEQEFADLDKIEAFVEANEGITLNELSTNHREILADVTLIEDTSMLMTADKMPIIGGFWWGCILGIVGLALVYFITDNDRDEVKKALIGCLITTVLIGIGGFVF